MAFPLNQLLGESTLSLWYGIENSWSICEQNLSFVFVKLLYSSLIFFCFNYFSEAPHGINIQLQILQNLKRG